jgi:hypothetical protein
MLGITKDGAVRDDCRKDVASCGRMARTWVYCGLAAARSALAAVALNILR